MINLLLYIVIIARDRHLPMLQQSRIISKGSPYAFDNLINIGVMMFFMCLMDLSRFPDQFWSPEHVLNLNIKEVTDISVTTWAIFLNT